jgi:hypothetical protein
MCSCVLRPRGIRSNVITALEKRQENQLAAQLDQLRELKLEIAALYLAPSVRKIAGRFALGGVDSSGVAARLGRIRTQVRRTILRYQERRDHQDRRANWQR